MNYFKNLFKVSDQKKTVTQLDQTQKLAEQLIVSKFRQVAKTKNCAPTEKTTDQKILEIYQLVGTAFIEEAKNRGEIISAGNINAIVFKFIQLYEIAGDTILSSHLKYEIDKFHREGLRPDYYEHEINIL